MFFTLARFLFLAVNKKEIRQEIFLSLVEFHSTIYQLATKQLTSVGVSEELSEKYMQLFTDLFKNVKYTAKEAKEDKDKNYTVEVEIEPAQIFDGVLEATQAEVESLVTAQAESGRIPSQMKII